jgi:hypothetical protein
MPPKGGTTNGFRLGLECQKTLPHTRFALFGNPICHGVHRNHWVEDAQAVEHAFAETFEDLGWRLAGRAEMAPLGGLPVAPSGVSGSLHSPIFSRRTVDRIAAT